jgi:hypothetical protein
LTKRKRGAGALPITDSDYFGSVLSLVDSADPDLPALQAQLDAHPLDARELCELVEALRREYESDRQRQVLAKRYRKNHMAMEYVADLWALQGKNQKTVKAFSEKAAALVWEKFGVNVKPKTVESRWLSRARIDAARAGHDLPEPSDAVAYAGGRLHFIKKDGNKSLRATIKIPGRKN